MTNRPIKDALRFVAAGGRLSKADLDALPYERGRRDETRSTIRRAAGEIAELRANSEHGSADRLAFETAVQFHEVDVEPVVEQPDETDPAVLASRIRRV